MKNLAPYLTFSDTVLVGVLGYLITVSHGQKFRVLAQCLELSRQKMGPQFFVWCLLILQWLLSKSFLSYQSAPFLVFCLQSRLLLGPLWEGSISIGISGLLAYSTPSPGNTKQKKNLWTNHCIIPWVSRSLSGLPPSHHFLGSSQVCFMCNVLVEQGFYLNKEKYIYPIFLEVLNLIFILSHLLFF